MFSGIGITGFLLIVLIALLLFGPSKLPELGRAVGKTLREFKKGANDAINQDSQPAPVEKVAEVTVTEVKPIANTSDSKTENKNQLPE